MNNDPKRIKSDPDYLSSCGEFIGTRQKAISCYDITVELSGAYISRRGFVERLLNYWKSEHERGLFSAPDEKIDAQYLERFFSNQISCPGIREEVREGLYQILPAFVGHPYVKNTDVIKKAWAKPYVSRDEFIKALRVKLTKIPPVNKGLTPLKSEFDSSFIAAAFKGKKSRVRKISALKDMAYNPQTATKKIVGILGERCTGKTNFLISFLEALDISPSGNAQLDSGLTFTQPETAVPIAIFAKSVKNMNFPEIVRQISEFYLSDPDIEAPLDPEGCLKIIQQRAHYYPALIILSNLDVHSQDQALVRAKQGGIGRLIEVIANSHPLSRLVYSGKHSIDAYIPSHSRFTDIIPMGGQTLYDLQYFASYNKKLENHLLDHLTKDDETIDVSGDLLSLLATSLSSQWKVSETMRMVMDGLRNKQPLQPDMIAHYTEALWDELFAYFSIQPDNFSALGYLWLFMAITEDGLEESSAQNLLRQLSSSLELAASSSEVDEPGEASSRAQDDALVKLIKFAKRPNNIVVHTQTPLTASHAATDVDDHYNTPQQGRKFISKLFLDRSIAQSLLAYCKAKHLAQYRNAYVLMANLARDRAREIRLHKRDLFGMTKYDFQRDIQVYLFLLESIEIGDLSKAPEKPLVLESEIFGFPRRASDADVLKYVYHILLSKQLNNKGHLGRVLDQNRLNLDLYMRLFWGSEAAFKTFKDNEEKPQAAHDKGDGSFQLPAHWNVCFSVGTIIDLLLTIGRSAYYADKPSITARISALSRGYVSALIDEGVASKIKQISFAQLTRLWCYELDAILRAPASPQTTGQMLSLNKAYDLQLKTIDEHRHLIPSRELKYIHNRFKVKRIQFISSPITRELFNGSYNETIDAQLCEAAQEASRLKDYNPNNFGRFGLRDTRVMFAAYVRLAEGASDVEGAKDRARYLKEAHNYLSDNVNRLNEYGGGDKVAILIDSARLAAARGQWKACFKYLASTDDPIFMPGTAPVYRSERFWQTAKIYLQAYMSLSANELAALYLTHQGLSEKLAIIIEQFEKEKLSLIDSKRLAHLKKNHKGLKPKPNGGSAK